jgi:chromosomal replication initiator protein
MSTAISERDLWLQILQKVEPDVKRPHFLTWFQNTCILSNENGRLIVGAPNMFAKDWLENKSYEELKAAIQSVDPSIQEITFQVTQADDARSVDVTKLFANDKKVRKLPGRQEVRLAEGVASKCLNPKYNLHNYIVGQDNRLAHAACMSVANNPGKAYNPLFIYGGVGLGKTHLLQATGNEILRKDSDKVVVYITSERFTNEIIEAIGKKNSKSFKDKYRKVDCLIIDDIQFLANKEMTQQEFFHTFNELYDNNKQIIISSDRSPKDLAGLEDRLVSRFGMGMIVDVQLPDYETRIAILQAKCREHGVLMHPEVLEFIAANVQDSIRELEGVLLQAIASAELEHSTPTVRSVASIIKKIKKVDINFDNNVPAPSRRSTSANEVIEIVATYFKMNTSDITGDVRRRDIMIPRQIAMYLIRHELNYSYEKIGEDFGGKNHTTVMHACEKIIKALKKDQHLLRDINSIKKDMGL